MWACLRCACCLALLAGSACSDDEGILVAASTDPSVQTPLDQLWFLIGLSDGTDSGVYTKDRDESEVFVGVAGRDLVADPYKLMLRDGGIGPEPSSVIVAVVGLRDGEAAAFGAFENEQVFVPGLVIRRDVVLAEDASYELTDTGCVSWGGNVIVDPSDLDCDNEPGTEDCDDLDPSRSHLFDEICDNGIDDDCDDEIDEACDDECELAADCLEANGDPPCGEWQCNTGVCDVVCPDCEDGDLDGYGIGAGCAGGDCDDAKDTVFDTEIVPCFSGPSSPGEGICRTGERTCIDGVFGPCIGQVVPSGEACNGLDDDCNGAVDDGLGNIECGLGACKTSVPACSGGVLGVCTPLAGAASDSDCDGVDDDCDGAIDEDCTACVRVALGGNDAGAIADDNTTPFATIQAAIDWAEEDGARPRIVCVAPGTSCGAIGTFIGAVSMADGISVYGGYRSSDWLRCTSSLTEISTGDQSGVVFPADVSSLTVLDGVRVLRAATPTTAGITVAGAHNVLISNVSIDTTPTVTRSYGVNLVGFAQATITRSRIFAGNGAVESIAIRSVNSTPIVVDNCNDLDPFGRCNSSCFNAADLGIRGRQGAGGSGDSFGVLLDSSPGAVVESTALCGGATDRSAAVRVVGEADGVVVRANNIQAFGGKEDSHGVWVEDCDGATPWIVGNYEILASGETPTTRVDGVRAVGSCHPVIDSNRSITGGSEGGAASTNGVHCLPNSLATPSRCVVLGNELVQGSKFGVPPTAIGVRCDGGSCGRIADNVILGNSAVESYGVYLEGSSAFIDGNDITGGCATAAGTGVYADDAFARLQNNFIRGGGCEGAAGADFRGLYVVTGSGRRELDVHSNTIDGDGHPIACESAAVVLDGVAGSMVPGHGIYRNNIFVGGECATSYGVEELQHGADPRIFENNNLDPRATPNALYLDETGTALTSAAEVNALTDASVAANLSVDSKFASYPANLHITTGSMCEGAGTPVGAPARDFDGDARDAASPDVGADEL